MRLQINLRGDLAKRTDQELAQRLEEAWQAYGTSMSNPRFKFFKVWASRRGPIRHPLAYRFTSFVGVDRGWAPRFVGPYFFLDPFLSFGGENPHLITCEIKDLYDEIQRRVELRRAGAI